MPGRAPCPGCGRLKPAFAIGEDEKCGDCRADDARAVQIAAGNPPPDPSWDDIRGQRNVRLQACDWTALPDAPLDAEELAAWAAYRTALRNITADFETPADVVWPAPPA